MNLDFLRRSVGIKPKYPTEEEIQEEILAKKLHNNIINNPEEWEEINDNCYIFVIKHKTKNITCKMTYDSFMEYVTIDGKTIKNPRGLSLYKIREIYRKMEKEKAIENLNKELMK